MPKKIVHIVHRDEPSDADKWRLMQARELLREAGYVEAADGTWHPAAQRP